MAERLGGNLRRNSGTILAWIAGLITPQFCSCADSLRLRYFNKNKLLACVYRPVGVRLIAPIHHLGTGQSIREIVPGYTGMSLAPRYLDVRITKEQTIHILPQTAIWYLSFAFSRIWIDAFPPVAPPDFAPAMATFHHVSGVCPELGWPAWSLCIEP
ncbi:hypothetical protein AGR1A_Cc30289 [Agrobacterium fabacearum CFBP 5771]|nr:hypothetical protein AGR1A_Cc30289 [Agrobacterium fabacearum CFBP 5771]